MLRFSFLQVLHTNPLPLQQSEKGAVFNAQAKECVECVEEKEENEWVLKNN